MERLTQRVQTGTLKGEPIYIAYKNDTEDEMSECFKSVLNRLADYEDTGLMPEDIAAYKVRVAEAERIMDMYLESDIKQQKEIFDLKERLKKAVELPCKIGDKICDIFLHIWEITEIDIYENTTVLRLGNKGTDNYSACHISEIGERYFFTREEAEKVLKEREMNVIEKAIEELTQVKLARISQLTIGMTINQQKQETEWIDFIFSVLRERQAKLRTNKE